VSEVYEGRQVVGIDVHRRGSVLVRMTEAGEQLKERVAARRGRNIATVAAARKLIGMVFYGLRDRDIRCLPSSRAG
jgi:hypothetical protein